MKQFDLPNPYEVEKHSCESRQEGDWIIFTCKQCIDYERRFNWRTGKMKVNNSTLHLHRGEHVPPGALYAFTNQN